ncbi:MAG TPA: VCBS repeat-containing protein [Candidatus Polarisedimenticolia bacterium]|nr:VCBS repeat-containing protein [Candidatus Polarisedimenticolia bacterium]
MRLRKPIPTRLSFLICSALTALAFSPALIAAPQFPNPVYPVGSNPWGMAKADFDGDGIDDLIVSNLGSSAPPGELSFLRGRVDGTFAPQVKIPLTQAPLEVYAGDFNNDGKPDLAVYYRFTAAFLLNQGLGIFGPETPLPTILSVRQLEMGDFNGDGIEDLVVYGDFSGQHFFQVLVFAGTGFYAGPAVPAGTHNFSPSPYLSMKAADFNGDGRDDIAVVTTIYDGTSDVMIYCSVGDGTFSAPFIYTTQRDEILLVFPAELNNDGQMDLVFESSYFVGGSSHFENVLMYGRGDGTLDPGPTLFVSAGAGLLNAIAPGDLNRDGIQDFVAASEYDFTVYLGLGGGSFAPQPVNYLGNGNAKALLTDLQGDGQADLVMLGNSSEAVFTILGNGDGSFGPAPIEALQYAPIGAAAVGDFNEDGKLDLAAGRVDANQVSLLFGNGDGSFGSESRIPGGVGALALAAADFDSDGHVDLAEAVLNWPYVRPNPIPPGTLIISKGNGDGTFAPPDSYATGPYPLRMVVSDFNSDGVPDIAVADVGNLVGVLSDVRVYLGSVGGSMSPALSKTIPTLPSDMAVGDFNLDGHPDLVVTIRNDRAPGTALILLGNGDGTFQNPITLATFSRTLNVAVAVSDLNGDGKPDLVVADSGDSLPPPNNPGAVHVFLGQGDATFVPGVTFLAGYGPYDVSLADFDGDSITDLFVETSNGYESFFPGLGNGTFGTEERYGLFGTPTILGSFDFNGDNLEDLLAFSSAGLFVIERRAPRMTNILDPKARFSAAGGRRKEIVEWSTDHEGDLTGFNLVTLTPGGHRARINALPIACAECTTGRGHSYAASLRAPGKGRTIYIEVLYRDGHSELFGPAEGSVRHKGVPSLPSP